MAAWPPPEAYPPPPGRGNPGLTPPAQERAQAEGLPAESEFKAPGRIARAAWSAIGGRIARDEGHDRCRRQGPRAGVHGLFPVPLGPRRSWASWG